jgi:hypothetical protein
MRTLVASLTVAVAIVSGGAAFAGDTPSPPGAQLYIGWPNDGEVIASCQVRVWFGLRNMGVAPAQEQAPNTGHHHLLIDTDLPSLDEPIPNDRNHLHFGGGQTETVVTLAPGTHTLQLILGDYRHVPHNPAVVSDRKTVTVSC